MLTLYSTLTYLSLYSILPTSSCIVCIRQRPGREAKERERKGTAGTPVFAGVARPQE